ncbi:MAG: histidine phosphatase family protein [Bacteroidales bacterium]|nr:histidine phosphatase family protein [Bacteroidales bacterium]
MATSLSKTPIFGLKFLLDKLMEIYIIRHGETIWNTQNRIQGQQDSPLTATGIEQAENVGKRLQGIHFNILYSSDLPRAMRTSEIINKYVGLPGITPEPGLRERHFWRF